MTRRIVGSGVLRLVLALAVAGLPASAETLTGRVVGVTDGDTLTVLVDGHQQVKVRLTGIDAPERGQPYGQQSKQALSTLVFGREVQIESAGLDKYGRTLGVVIVADVDVQTEQLRLGLAWVYRQYSDDARLLALETEAKAARRGLWADANPIPPWDWRHGATAAPEPKPPISKGRCGAKRTCAEMTSCDEARFYLTQCGVSRLDGDRDGTPCESLCR